jgi:hypothetical protein
MQRIHAASFLSLKSASSLYSVRGGLESRFSARFQPAMRERASMRTGESFPERILAHGRVTRAGKAPD